MNEAQLVGRVKAQETRRSQPKTQKEIEQFNEFRRVGTEAARIANTGSKILHNLTTGKRKFAKPGSDKWNELIEAGFITKS